MGEEQKSTGKRLIDEVEHLVDDVNKAVRVAVARGTEAADVVSVNIKDGIKETIQGVRASRNSVVMVRVSEEAIERLDTLVVAGIAGSRSEAAAFLIGEGVKARQGLFDKIADKVDQIRRTKEELRTLLDEDRGGWYPIGTSEVQIWSSVSPMSNTPFPAYPSKAAPVKVIRSMVSSSKTSPVTNSKLSPIATSISMFCRTHPPSSSQSLSPLRSISMLTYTGPSQLSLVTPNSKGAAPSSPSSVRSPLLI